MTKRAINPDELGPPHGFAHGWLVENGRKDLLDAPLLEAMADAGRTFAMGQAVPGGALDLDEPRKEEVDTAPNWDIPVEDTQEVRAARGALLWTSGTSSSPGQTGTLLRRHVAGFYSAIDNPPNRRGAP